MWNLLSQFRLSSPRRELAHARATLRRMAIEEQQITGLSDAELLRESSSLRYRAKCGEALDTLMPRAFALVRETASRQLGMRHFDVQVLGGAILARGCLAEMATGEGKTLAAVLPLYLHALAGQGAHLATTNDYLAQRDADWMRPVFEALGMSVGVVQSEASPTQRRAAYACDVTYGTAKEFGFDFLRDRLLGEVDDRDTYYESAPDGRVQRGLNFALVDEADSILIDEARIPLIISQEEPEASETIAAASQWGATFVGQLRLDEHYSADPDTSGFHLTPSGRTVVRRAAKPATMAQMPADELYHSIEQAILVHRRFRPEEHYVVENGEIVIVDEFNGRLAAGRRWRHGVHQAIEAREGVDISPVTGSAAQITMQEFFLRYQQFAGMSGTLHSAAREIANVYQRPTVAVPLNRPSRRTQWPDRVFVTAAEKWQAIVDEIQTLHSQGRPVLIGTRSIDKSELLSQRLEAAGIPHQVLNARHTRSEAERIARAGQRGQVTVATNMAGRGTDIKLQPGIAELGGLHVIGTELHESARIDRQLSGRAARQGDPGSCRMFVSFEDEILESGFGDRQAAKLRDAAAERNSTAGCAELFRSAQRAVERSHARQRRQLIQAARYRHDRLEELGLDPFLEVQDDTAYLSS